MRPWLAAFTALALLLPAAASADPFDDVFADYQQDGRIDPCAHSEAELQQAKRDIPNDIEQYAPDFPAELDEAMEARARSGCPEGGGAATTTEPTDPAAGTGGATPPPAPSASEPNPPGQAPGPPGTAQPADAAKDG